MKPKGIGAAAFIANDAGHVLLVKHTYGQLNWELPGGGAEDNESPEETAIREVREETGLIVTALSLTGYYYSTENDTVHLVFRCVPIDPNSPAEADRSEISECRFWPVDNLPRPISDWTVQRITDALSGSDFGLPTKIGPRVWFW